jgi:hypothetical protein
MTRAFDPTLVTEVVDRIRPILGGHHPAVQGAVVADLVAIWLAGHQADLREVLLDNHIDTVRQLVPANVAAMGVFKR